MRVHQLLPALLAVGAALLIAGGTVLRQRASAVFGRITASWWLGAAIALTGFGLQAGALAVGTLLLVQPLLVLAVLFALPLEAWADHRHPSRGEWMWGVLLAASVALFLVAAAPSPTDARPNHVILAGTISVVIVVLIGLVVIGEWSSAHYRSLSYGLVSGTFFGVSALLVKSVLYQVLHYPAVVLTRPEVYLFIVAAVGGVLAQQRAFSAGELQTSFPAMIVMEPTVSMLLGMALLGERVRVTSWQAVFVVAILVVLVRAVVELAKLSAIRGDQQAGELVR